MLQLQADFKAKVFSKLFRQIQMEFGIGSLIIGARPICPFLRRREKLGLRPSAIRYYEQIGLLPFIQRTGGQRRYDTTSLYRLAVIQRARQTGFTLDEIQELFFGFTSGTRPRARWQELSQRKLVELEASIDRIKTMQRLLVRLQHRCHCDTLDECGKRLLKRRITDVQAKSLPAQP
jgi:MerR family transcriptional regulator, redox-sensitive transcriptional activator SoxR